MKKKLILVCTIFMVAVNTILGQGLDIAKEKSAIKKVPGRSMTRSLKANPPSASLQQFCPSVGNQGKYGTCVAWAISTARAITFAHKSGLTSIEEIDKYRPSPEFIYHYIKDPTDYNCQSGSIISSACLLMQTVGAPAISEFSQSCPATIPDFMLSKAASFKIDHFFKTFDSSENDCDEIQKNTKTAISQSKPVIVGVAVDLAFQKKRPLYTPDATDTKRYGHAMTVIGYDDNKYGGAFQLVNSWGEAYGEKGYFWMKYADFCKFSLSGYEIVVSRENVVPQEKDTPVVNVIKGETVLVDASGNTLTSTTVTTSEGKKINRTLIVSNSSSENISYAIDQTFKTGDRIQIKLQNALPMYVYAFGIDDNNISEILFPPHNGKAFIDYTSGEVVIPDINRYIEFGNQPGNENLIILYSIYELDIKEIQSSVVNGSGTIISRLKAAIGYSLTPTQDIIYGKTKFTWELKPDARGSVVPMLFSFRHI